MSKHPLKYWNGRQWLTETTTINELNPAGSMSFMNSVKNDPAPSRAAPSSPKQSKPKASRLAVRLAVQGKQSADPADRVRLGGGSQLIINPTMAQTSANTGPHGNDLVRQGRARKGNTVFESTEYFHWYHQAKHLTPAQHEQAARYHKNQSKYYAKFPSRQGAYANLPAQHRKMAKWHLTLANNKRLAAAVGKVKTEALVFEGADSTVVAARTQGKHRRMSVSALSTFRQTR